MNDTKPFRRHCSRCRSLLTENPFHSAPYFTSHCLRCGHVNVLGADSAELPLGEILTKAGLPMNPDVAAEGVQSHAFLDQTLRAMLVRVLQLLGEDRELHLAATHFCLQQHVVAATTAEQRRGDETLNQSASARALSLVFLLARQGGEFDLETAREATRRPDFRAYWEALSATLMNTMALGSVLLNCRQGQRDVSVRGGDGVVTLTATHLDYVEWGWNQPSTQNLGEADKRWIKTMDEALKVHRGQSQLDYIGCVGRGGPPRRTREPTGIRASTWLQADQFDDGERRLLQTHSLTWARVESLERPWFYDLAPRRDHAVDRAELLFSLATQNWLAYFSLLPMRWSGQEGFLSLDNLLYVSLNNLVSAKSRLLEELWTRRDDAVTGAEGVKRLGRLRRDLNQLLEQHADEFLRADGWATRLATTHKGAFGQEEIDVLATRVVGSTRWVLVVESKDFDFRLGTINGSSHMKRRAGDAQKQVLRKAAFVRENPGVLQQAFGLGADACADTTILPLIVTREGLPLGMFGEVFPIAVNELPGLLKGAHDQPDLTIQTLQRIKEPG